MGQYKSKGYFYDLLSKQNNISMGCTKIAIYIVAESLTKLASFILKKHQLNPFELIIYKVYLNP